jgi:hypothetical protein
MRWLHRYIDKTLLKADVFPTIRIIQVPMILTRRKFVEAGLKLAAVSSAPLIMTRGMRGFYGDLKSHAYLGQVATRSLVPNAHCRQNLYGMSRSSHFARDQIASVKIILSNWYGSEGPTQVSIGNETSTSVSANVRATIEYPVGAFTQILFDGSAMGTIPASSNIVSDFANVSIPNGAPFWVRVFWKSGGGIVYSTNPLNEPMGDAYTVSATPISDQTMGGTVRNNGGGGLFVPSAIVAKTSRPSILMIGDSRTIGIHDSADDSLDQGETARSIGPNFGYIVRSSAGQMASNFVISHARSLELATYCSHVISGYGINDIGPGGASAATLENSLRSIWALFSQPIFQLTLAPVTSGAWTAVDGSDQMVEALESARVIVNDWIRTTPAGLSGYFDVADKVESSRNSGKWRADGSPEKYTTDGVHENQFANLAIQSSTAIPSSIFRISAK